MKAKASKHCNRLVQAQVRLWHFASFRCAAKIGRYWWHSVHWSALALNGSVTIDPKRTLGPSQSANCYMVPAMIADSTITCPKCGHAATEQMPTNACQFFYDCNGCGKRLKPKPGDCCVFCSYGSVPCPSIQQNQSCCS